MPQGQNSYHVVRAIGTDTGSLLDRFVIEGGRADDASITPDRGGGLNSEQVLAVRLKDCEFRSNYAGTTTATGFSGGGGGAFLSAALIEVEDCDFKNNFSFYGGGAYVESTNSSRIDRCRFYDNSSGEAGPGLYVNQGDSIDIRHSVFYRNSHFGGPAGGAISLSSVAGARVINCTIVYNSYSGSAASAGFGIHNTGPIPEITNCIVWGNGSLLSDTGEGQIFGATWTYSLVEGGPSTNGNINTQPQFVNSWLDLSLIATSPGVDAGNNMAVDRAAYSLNHGRRFDDSENMPDTGQGSGGIVDMGRL